MVESRGAAVVNEHDGGVGCLDVVHECLCVWFRSIVVVGCVWRVCVLERARPIEEVEDIVNTFIGGVVLVEVANGRLKDLEYE